MLQDLKDACRALAKSKWFTCVTVLTLALGIGANTAIFGVVNRLMLNPLPYPNADELVYLLLNVQGFQGETFGFPAPNSVVAAWRNEARTLDGVESFSSASVLAYDENGGRVLRGMRVTPGLPGLLDVAPVLGRGFTAADTEVGAPAVVVLSYEVWQRDHGGLNDVLGRAITLDEVPHVIVGVWPPRWDAFTRGQRPEIWFPLSLDPATALPGAFQASEAIARMRPDVDREAVRRELDPIVARVEAEAPRRFFGNQAATARVEGSTDRINAGTRDALLILLGAVGLVLLVACSNVANLLLARSASRARELALRSALGARAGHLIRALFAECLVLALAAGAVGVALGWVTLRILVRVRPNSLPQLGEVQVDTTVVAFTFGLSVATALLFGLAPALQLRSRKLADALRHGASGTVRGGGGPRLRKLLVAAQMALSVVLLVSAGLLVRSVVYLQNVDLGFDTHNLFTAQLTLPRGRYQEGASREVLLEQLLARLRASPGVAAATQASYAPPNFMALISAEFEIRGVTVSEADLQAPKPMNSVQPDYFATLGIRLLQGRTFTPDEPSSGALVMLVDEATARHFWPDGNAVGAEVKIGQDWRTVVGVTDNIASSPTQSRDGWQFYTPSKQGQIPPGAGPPSLTLIVRAAGDPAVAMAALRAATRELDPEIAIPSVLLTDTALAGTIEGPRFNMALLTAFAVIALVLAGVGLAAVIGYEVTERTHEFGIRMALGARTEDVRRLAMRHGLTPALVGVVCGVVGALAATGLAQRMLHGITPRDPLTFVGVVTLLVLVAVGASWVPAKRATRVDPIIALRAD
jgi:putative ABC transport system permease protein